MTASDRSDGRDHDRALLPPHGLLLALLAVAAVALLVPAPAWPVAEWRLLGLLPMQAGVALMVAAWLAFQRHRIPIDPRGRPAVLVTGGVYRLSRNPMYLAMLCLPLGAALLLASPPALTVTPVFGRWLRRRFVEPEERVLAEAFGSRFEAWCGRTRRWL